MQSLLKPISQFIIFISTILLITSNAQAQLDLGGLTKGLQGNGNAGVVCYQQQKLQDPETGKLISFNWCYQRFANTTNDRIVYFFHGAGGNETSYVNSAEFNIHAHTRNVLGIPSPVTVSISFGPLWLASEKPSKTVAGNPRLLKFISETVIPYIENSSVLTGFLKTTVVNGARKYQGTRFLMGESMGGFNAAQFATKKPGMFKKVVLGCPGFFTFNPFSPTVERDVEDYIYRNHASRADVAYGIQILAADFTNAAEWNAHDPVKLTSLMTPASSQIFVWYNTNDQFGFQEGALQFSSKARSRGVTVHQAGNGIYSDNNMLLHCMHDALIDMTLTQFLQ